MRLTLRTLLAWLDGVLPAGEQEALAAKVASSMVAAQLTSRIRSVVSRDTVPAPRIDGRGLAEDANTLAEYLDNALAPDQLEAFERICIESDIHLAEAASCHGLLAEVLRNPAAAVPLDATGRRRVLAAMREHTVSPPRDPDQEAAVMNARALRSALDARLDEASGHDRILVAAPARASRRPASAPVAAWLAALAAVLLLTVLAAVLVWQVRRDRGPRRGQAARGVVEPADRQGAEPVAAQPAVPVAQASPVTPAKPPVSPPPSPAVPDMVASEPVAADRVEADHASAKPEPPSAAPPVATSPPQEPRPPMTPPDLPRVPHGDALAIAAPSPGTPRASTPAGAPPAAAGAPPGPVAPDAPAGDAVAGRAGLLVHRLPDDARVPGRSGWEAVPPEAPLAEREELLAPAFCRPEVKVSGVTIRLEPLSCVTLDRDPDGTPRVEVVFGRVVAVAAAADARLGITAGGISGVVTQGLGTPLGVEVALERPPGAEAASVRAALETSTGAIGWRQTSGNGAAASPPLEGVAAAGLVDARCRLAWNDADPGEVAVDRNRETPPWIDRPPRPDRVEQSAAVVLATRAASTPLDVLLQELATDRRAEQRAAALATLALLGDFDALVRCLAAEEQGRRLDERQWRALEESTVQLALARGENAAARVERAFAAQVPGRRGAAAFALARGMSDEALSSGGDVELVAALEDEHLLIRRYAFKNLVEIVRPSAGDQIRYRPDRQDGLRSEGVDWWRAQQQRGRIRRTSPADG